MKSIGTFYYSGIFIFFFIFLLFMEKTNYNEFLDFLGNFDFLKLKSIEYINKILSFREIKVIVLSSVLIFIYSFIFRNIFIVLIFLAIIGFSFLGIYLAKILLLFFLQNKIIYGNLIYTLIYSFLLTILFFIINEFLYSLNRIFYFIISILLFIILVLLILKFILPSNKFDYVYCKLNILVVKFISLIKSCLD